MVEPKVKPNVWKVKFVQKDKPDHSFEGVYSTEEEFKKWADLHNRDFDVYVREFFEAPVVEYKWPDRPEHGIPEVFKVAHYFGDEHPRLEGLSHSLQVIAERDELETFAAFLNTAICSASRFVDQEVTFTVEAHIASRDKWVPIQSGLPNQEAVDDLMVQLNPSGSILDRSTARIIDFRTVRVVREIGPATDLRPKPEDEIPWTK